MNANFTEETVSVVLQMFLSVAFFPWLPPAITLFSANRERILGVDGRIGSRMASFRPFYMQFKRPSLYSSRGTSEVMQYRNSNGFLIEPSVLYFRLRARRQNQHDSQHNILVRLGDRLRNRGLGDAAYVCPLFMDQQEYMMHIQVSALLFRRWLGPEPWFPDDVEVNDAQTLSSYFLNVPVFPAHVSIPAHRRVQDQNHSYSFTNRGEGILFHSPERVEDGDLLSQWLSKLAKQAKEKDVVVDRKNSALLLKELSADIGFKLQTSDWISSWLSFGSFLSEQYGIHQYAFINWE